MYQRSSIQNCIQYDKILYTPKRVPTLVEDLTQFKNYTDMSGLMLPSLTVQRGKNPGNSTGYKFLLFNLYIYIYTYIYINYLLINNIYIYL